MKLLRLAARLIAIPVRLLTLETCMNNKLKQVGARITYIESRQAEWERLPHEKKVKFRGSPRV